MAKSFFERLTGSIRVNEDEGAFAPAKRPSPPPRLAKRKVPEAAEAQEQAEEKVIHPVAVASPAENDTAVSAPAEEEGELTVDIYDNGSHIIIQSTVAGVKPEDIDISLEDDTLTIRGSRKRAQEVDDGNFYYRELYWGAFSRSIILPEEVDFAKSDAVIKNGLLTIKLPKKDKGEKKIRVKIGD